MAGEVSDNCGGGGEGLIFATGGMFASCDRSKDGCCVSQVFCGCPRCWSLVSRVGLMLELWGCSCCC